MDDEKEEPKNEMNFPEWFKRNENHIDAIDLMLFVWLDALCVCVRVWIPMAWLAVDLIFTAIKMKYTTDRECSYTIYVMMEQTNKPAAAAAQPKAHTS